MRQRGAPGPERHGPSSSTEDSVAYGDLDKAVLLLNCQDLPSRVVMGAVDEDSDVLIVDLPLKVEVELKDRVFEETARRDDVHLVVDELLEEVRIAQRVHEDRVAQVNQRLEDDADRNDEDRKGKHILFDPMGVKSNPAC